MCHRFTVVGGGPVQFLHTYRNESAKKTYIQIASALQSIDLKCFFCKTASLQNSSRGHISAPVSHCLPSLAPGRIHLSDVALDHVVLYSTGFAIVWRVVI